MVVIPNLNNCILGSLFFHIHQSSDQNEKIAPEIAPEIASNVLIRG